MNRADDFMKAFFIEYPQAKSGQLSMEELNILVAEYQHKLNNRPVQEFDMLTPDQMQALLYAPFLPGSIGQFSENMESHLDKVPIFKLSELLIAEIATAGTLKLTAKGNLPVRICKLLYSQELITWEYMEYFKTIREEEIPYLWPLKQYLLDMGIAKKRNNALSLTNKGKQFLENPPATRFINLLSYFTTRFHWGNFYGTEDGGKCGNLGWAYSLFLLSKYGESPRKSEFYSLKLINAFMEELWDQPLGEQKKAMEEHHYTYSVRFFECFANWFGFVNIERNRDYSLPAFSQQTITKSALFDQLFNWSEHSKKNKTNP